VTETAPDNTIVFAEGIPGFPDHQEFQLVDFADGESAFQLLQSTTDPDLSMIVCSPWMFFPDYAPEITDVDRDGLDLVNPDDAVVFCPVTIDSEDSLSVNLLGPFVVNAGNRKGRQVVLVDSEYSVRTPLEIVSN
jgi:flagellar assembly factor FliW